MSVLRLASLGVSLKVTIEIEGAKDFAPQYAAYRLAAMLARRGHRVSVRLNSANPAERHAEARRRRAAMRAVNP
jgi:hypothetical protein